MSDPVVKSEHALQDVASVPGQPRVLLDAEAETAIETHVQSDPTNEVCGVLFGTHGEDSDGHFVHITRAVEGKFADQKSTSVKFTHETWNYINGLISDEGGDAAIVGWYHSHPGFGVFYSADDSFIQKHFFGLPWQVGIVMDPSTNERGVFANLATKIEGLESYWRLEAGEAAAEPIKCQYKERVGAQDPEVDSGAAADTERLVQILDRLHAMQQRIDGIKTSMNRMMRVTCIALVLSLLTFSIISSVGVWAWMNWHSFRAERESIVEVSPLQEVAPYGKIKSIDSKTELEQTDD